MDEGRIVRGRHGLVGGAEDALGLGGVTGPAALDDDSLLGRHFAGFRGRVFVSVGMGGVRGLEACRCCEVLVVMAMVMVMIGAWEGKIIFGASKRTGLDWTGRLQLARWWTVVREISALLIIRRQWYTNCY